MTKLQVINNVTANTSFQAKPTGAKTSTNPNDKGVSTTTKVVIGAGLTALAAVGIYIATRGKSKVVKNPASGLNELVVNFKKGIAELPNGEKYTGEVVKELKDGSKVTLEYLNGVLQKSTKTKDGEKVFEKLYSYLDNGKIKAIQQDGKSIFTRTMKDGVETVTTSNAVITKEGQLIDILRNDNSFVQIDTYNKTKRFQGFVNADGLVVNGNRFYDPKLRLNGQLTNQKLIVDGKDPYYPELKGLATNYSIVDTQQANLGANRSCLTETFTIDNGMTHFSKGLDITPDGRKVVRLKISRDTGATDDVVYNALTGVVKQGDNVLFKYNPKTKELSNLAIDEKEAKDLIKLGEEHYNFYRRAMNSRKRSLTT